MRKTKSIVTASIAASAFALLMGAPAPASADGHTIEGPKVSWKFSTWGKRRAWTEGAEYLSQELSKRTNGNFKFKIYYGEQLSKSKENLDGLAVGAFEAASFCAAYHPKKNRALNVLDMPFLPIPNFDVQIAVSEAIYNHPIAQKNLSAWNTIPWFPSILPQYEYMGKGPAPKSVADFKGMRLRALGGMGRAAKAIGAIPTTVTASEGYNALARGTVDAFGFPFTYAFSAYKLDEVSEWYTTNMKLGSVNCPIAFNMDAWNALPKQYQALMNSLKPGMYKAMAIAYGKKDVENLANWPKKMKAITISEAEMANFRKIGGEPLWNQWVKENQKHFDARALMDLVLSTAKEAAIKFPKAREYKD